jgi:hypothetical protein
MQEQNQLSREQLELQMRMAQGRIDEINRILKSGVQASVTIGMDKDAVEVVRRLYDTSLSDADILSCIGILEMLILIDGLAPLLNVMKSETYNLPVRQRAAKAISVIGSGYVEQELNALRSSSSPALCTLAKMASGGTVEH